MTALLTAIVVWLSANFELPPDHHLPRVSFASREAIAELGYRDASGLQAPASDQNTGRREVVAVYDSRSETIYLSDGWRGETPAEVSVLVHEMVHHLQHRAGLKFACPQEREALAYKAQSAWLAMSGTDLATEFELDGFTLLVKTRCL
jgi:hypothetical protein